MLQSTSSTIFSKNQDLKLPQGNCKKIRKKKFAKNVQIEFLELKVEKQLPKERKFFFASNPKASPL